MKSSIIVILIAFTITSFAIASGTSDTLIPITIERFALVTCDTLKIGRYVLTISGEFLPCFSHRSGQAVQKRQQKPVLIAILLAKPPGISVATALDATTLRPSARTFASMEADRMMQDFRPAIDRVL